MPSRLRARSVPDDVLRVDLVVPKYHVLVVVLFARVSNTGLCKYGIERSSWRGWIVRWTPFGLMFLGGFKRKAHCHTAAQHTMLATRIHLQSILVRLAHCVRKVRASTIESGQLRHTLIESNGGKYLGSIRFRAMPQSEFIDSVVKVVVYHIVTMTRIRRQLDWCVLVVGNSLSQRYFLPLGGGIYPSPRNQALPFEHRHNQVLRRTTRPRLTP
jgi:hypothetical protein